MLIDLINIGLNNNNIQSTLPQNNSCVETEKLYNYIFNEKKLDDKHIEIFKFLPDDIKFINENNLDKCISKNKKKRIFKNLKYLTGFWFEDYLFEYLQKITDKLKQEGIKINLHRNIKFISESNPNNNFELDFIIQHNFNIFGLSCTICDEKPVIKSKFSEVIHRTQQFSGDEAKVILKSFIAQEKITEIEQEIQKDFGSNINYFINFNHNIFDDKESFKLEIKKLLNI